MDHSISVSVKSHLKTVLLFLNRLVDLSLKADIFDTFVYLFKTALKSSPDTSQIGIQTMLFSQQRTPKNAISGRLETHTMVGLG